MNEYMTIKQAAQKWGIGERRINTLCQEGRIEGAVKFGKSWAIPADAKKPIDQRIKTGRYIKQNNIWLRGQGDVVEVIDGGKRE